MLISLWWRWNIRFFLNIKHDRNCNSFDNDSTVQCFGPSWDDLGIEKIRKYTQNFFHSYLDFQNLNSCKKIRRYSVKVGGLPVIISSMIQTQYIRTSNRLSRLFFRKNWKFYFVFILFNELLKETSHAIFLEMIIFGAHFSDELFWIRQTKIFHNMFFFTEWLIVQLVLYGSLVFAQ